MTISTAEQEAAWPVTEGDFFVCSWGYDQTNIDFYKVIAVSPSGKTVTIQEWEQVGQRGRDHDQVMPGAGPRQFPRWVDGQRDGVTTAAPQQRRVNRRYGAPMLTMSSYSIARLWDGRVRYQTASGAGH